MERIKIGNHYLTANGLEELARIMRTQETSDRNTNNVCIYDTDVGKFEICFDSDGDAELIRKED